MDIVHDKLGGRSCGAFLPVESMYGEFAFIAMPDEVIQLLDYSYAEPIGNAKRVHKLRLLVSLSMIRPDPAADRDYQPREFTSPAQWLNSSYTHREQYGSHYLIEHNDLPFGDDLLDRLAFSHQLPVKPAND